MENTQSTLAELVRAHPGAARVLHRYRLDFCCGGQRRLDEACAGRGLDAAAVLAEASRNDGEDPLPRAESLAPAALVDFIIVRFHEPLREELGRLLALAQKVERRHAERPDCPRGLARHLVDMRAAVESHLDKEEQILFPMIRAGRGHLAQMPIRVMFAEHDDHAVALRTLRALAHDFEPPADACGSWRALCDGLRALELDLMRHIHLENNVLFPAVLGS